ncbi:hypothetical protein [Motilibacter peucedani]|uniref:hypothetical protein n=1 Tax=Motilibacter peucedani TaxID=598650 RepID=UPI000EADBFDD|nr:hypothetical protein [Motilibacter peucedani]
MCTAAAYALVVVTTGACTISVGSSTADKDPLVKDDKTTLDLRQTPTRATLHIPEGAGGSGFAAKDDKKGIDVTVLLPGGASTHITAYRVATSTQTSDPESPPSVVYVNVKYPSVEKLSEALWDQQGVLRLSTDDLTRTVGPKPGSTDSAAPATALGVVKGLHEGVLILDVDVREGAEAGSASATYSFSFDIPVFGSATASPSASAG